MVRFLALLSLLFLLVGCASTPSSSSATTYAPPPGSIVLRVEVLDVQFTDLYPGCGEVQDCVPFHFWWRYRARVKEVISGAWTQPEVTFTNLQHAGYIDRVTKDCYVVLVPAGDEIRSKVGVPLVADRLLSRFFVGDRALIKALRDGA